MAKNIEMQLLNSSGSYEAVYPKTLGNNVIMDNGETIEEKITHVGVSSAFEVGDVLFTTRGRPNEDWLLCDGSEYKGASYSLPLTASIGDTWKSISWSVGLNQWNSFKYNDNIYYYRLETDGSQSFYIHLEYIGEDGIAVEEYETSAYSSGNYISSCGAIVFEGYLYVALANSSQETGSCSLYRIALSTLTSLNTSWSHMGSWRIFRFQDSYGTLVYSTSDYTMLFVSRGNLYLYGRNSGSTSSIYKWNGSSFTVLKEEWSCATSKAGYEITQVFDDGANTTYIEVFQDSTTYQLYYFTNDTTFGTISNSNSTTCNPCLLNGTLYVYTYKSSNYPRMILSGGTRTLIATSDYTCHQTFMLDGQMYYKDNNNNQLIRVTSITYDNYNMTHSGEVVDTCANIPWAYTTNSGTVQILPVYYSTSSAYWTNKSKVNAWLPVITLTNTEAYIKAR